VTNVMAAGAASPQQTPGSDMAAPAPPVAKRVAHVVRSPHGDRVDEYYWMRDDDPKAKRPEIIEHLKAENAYTEAMLAPHALAFWLKDLASEFHGYYNAERFLVDDAALRSARLALLLAVRRVLRIGLALIGVSAPERM
jgi:hypothetical protein